MRWVQFMLALEIVRWAGEAQRGVGLVQATQPGDDGVRLGQSPGRRCPESPGGLPGRLVVIDIEQRIRKRAGWLMRSSPLLGHLKHDWIFTRPSGLGSGFCVRSQL